MFYTEKTQAYKKISSVKKEIDKIVERLKEQRDFYPYIIHYMYDMQKKEYSAQIVYYNKWFIRNCERYLDRE